jgi:hypothetical protein
MIDALRLQGHLVGEGKHMAKKKVSLVQDELKNVAVAVGSALGKLAAKIKEVCATTSSACHENRRSERRRLRRNWSIRANLLRLPPSRGRSC